MMSVDELASIPSLGLRYLAGAQGGVRLVTWAHACDLPDPWCWVDPGDVVMTTGVGLPAESDDQVAWMRSLVDSKVSALVVALHPDARPLAEASLRVADERDFPVLSADFDLHFVSLARTLIESAMETERRRLTTIKRVYDVYSQLLQARGKLGERIHALERVTGWGLAVRDNASNELVVSGRSAQSLRSDQRWDDPSAVEIRGLGAVTLIAVPESQPVSDIALLHHIAGLIGLELEHDAADKDRLRDSGEDLLGGLLDESITTAAVWPLLGHRGMTGSLVVAYWNAAASEPLHRDGIHRLPVLHDCAPLFAVRERSLIGIVPRDFALLESISTTLASGCVVGVSAALTVNSSIVEALRQAQLAAARAREQDGTLSVHGEDEMDAGFLPHSVDDARRVVRATLGPLIAKDKRTDGALVHSLRVFLENDGAWQKSAGELGIHRQTLVYRLRQVEELTGFKPTSTHGGATLWFALRAADGAGLALDDLLE